MRKLILAALLLPGLAPAEDADAFARALKSGHVERVDAWVKHELRRMRKGHVRSTPSTSFIVHGPTFDSLVAFLRRQPGVLDAAWDKCVKKAAIWPGHSRIGVRFGMNGTVYERCHDVQEGIPGSIKLFGWRPHVRKDRQMLRYQGANECRGFVEKQNRICGQP